MRESVDDEWFVVHLVKSMTARFDTLSAIIRDNDGDFVLMEAAEELPEWLEPSTSANRIFIRRDALHIIEPKSWLETPDGPITPISPTDAIRRLGMREGKYVASDRIQNMVWARIRGFPEKALQKAHVASCLLPLRAAHVVRRCPGLVASAIRIFANRNVEDVSHAANGAFWSNACSCCRARGLSRIAYAQLRKDEAWHTPKVFLKNAAWKAHLCDGDGDDEISRIPAIVGSRLACALEMMYYREADSHVSTKDVQHMQQCDVRPRFRGFCRVLKSLGFFDEDMSDKTVAAAKSYFTCDDICEVQLASRIDELVDNEAFSADDFPNSVAHMPNNEDWLQVSPADVDDHLSKLVSAAAKFMISMRLPMKSKRSSTKTLVPREWIAPGAYL